MSLFSYRTSSYALLLFTTLLSILGLTDIVTANTTPHSKVHYDPPIPLHFSSCTPSQISALTSEIHVIRQLSSSISENWQNKNYSAHIRDAYNYFYTAGDTEPLYSYESTQVRRGLQRVLARMGKIQVLGAEDPRGPGLWGVGQKRRGRQQGLRIVCKPKREADCGNAIGEGVEAFVSNGPTIRVGPEVEALAVTPASKAFRSNTRNPKSHDTLAMEANTQQTKETKSKQKQEGKWLLTNGNDVHLCPLFWKNKSLDISNAWETLREIPVGDFVDYRLLTLMHEFTHTHSLTGDIFISQSHEDRLSLGLLDHGYGLRQPRSNENPDPSRLPQTYGERVVWKYDDSGKAVAREVKKVPYVTELIGNEAWSNADTLVYFVFVAWQGECENTHSHEITDSGERRGEKSREQASRGLRAAYTHGMGRQVVIQNGGWRPDAPVAPGRKCAQQCPPGKEPILEILRGSGRGRNELKRIWCKSLRTGDWHIPKDKAGKMVYEISGHLNSG